MIFEISVMKNVKCQLKILFISIKSTEIYIFITIFKTFYQN